MDMNQVTLPATDVARSAAFYRKLGLVQIVEDLPKYARFELPNGAATLSLHHVDPPPAQPGVVIYFECADLDARVAELKRKGVAFDADPVAEAWLWRDAYLR